MSRRPDLIVPIRDRRQRKRYLTLRNFGIALAALLIAFILINIRSEMRGATPGDYGRLFGRQVPPVGPKPIEVVREEPPPVADGTSPDPMLVERTAEAQWLEEQGTTAPVTASVRGQAEVAIVGGAEGVTVVRKEKRRPVLAGGFGR